MKREEEPASSSLLPSLDPLERALLPCRPVQAAAAPLPVPPPSAAVPPLEQLVERLLRRVALGGTRHRGTALLHVGSGSMQGAAITVHAEGSSLRIEIDAPDNDATRAWRAGLQQRLRDRGLDAQVS